MLKIKEIKVGDSVFTYDYDGNIEKVIIKEIVNEKRVRLNNYDGCHSIKDLFLSKKDIAMDWLSTNNVSLKELNL